MGRAQDIDVTRRCDLRECRPILAVVVADEEARALAERRGLAQLLGDPGVRGVARHADMDDTPRTEGDDEQREQRPETHVGDREAVAGPDVRGVIAQERRPGLPARARGTRSAQVGLDRPLGDTELRLPQLAADPLGAPQRIVGRQPPDQGDGLGRERRATRLCWPVTPSGRILWQSLRKSARILLRME